MWFCKLSLRFKGNGSFSVEILGNKKINTYGKGKLENAMGYFKIQVGIHILHTSISACEECFLFN